MSNVNSQNQIARSSSIICGASFVNILMSLLRVKVAASLPGPTSVGLIGLFNNLISTASAVSSLGFGSVGTRQIVGVTARYYDAVAVVGAHRTLFWWSLNLAAVLSSAIDMTVLWLCDVQALLVFEKVGL